MATPGHLFYFNLRVSACRQTCLQVPLETAHSRGAAVKAAVGLLVWVLGTDLVLPLQEWYTAFPAQPSVQPFP